MRVPTTVPFGQTARRLEWPHLPPGLRAMVERKIGSPVVDADSQASGFTPGFASVLTTEADTRHFVKAASTKAQRPFATAYREEARKLGLLPEDVPAPRLLWIYDANDWVVLETEYVDARLPHRPWQSADLDAALDLLETVAARLSPPPEALNLPTFAEEFDELPGYWAHIRARGLPVPGLAEHLDEAAALTAGFADICAGTTLVHTDARDDNLLVRPDGTALLCDWNFPCLGAPWVDSVMLLVGPRGDGLDVDALLAARPLTLDVPPESVDVVIALLTGYFLRQADEPAPPTSPHLRDFQRWQGEVCWDWLSERRGWA